MKTKFTITLFLLIIPFLSFALPTLIYPSSTTITYGTLTEVRPTLTSQNSTYALQNIPTALTGLVAVGVNNARVTIQSTAPAGTYTIVVRATDGTGSTDATFILQIDKAPLTVTATSSTITYCDGFPACTANFTGFKNNENQGVLSGTLNCSYDVAAPAPAGTYTIDIATNSTLSSPNYTITYVNGTLTVSQSATTTAVLPSNTSILVGNSMTFTATVNGNLTCIPVGAVTFNIDGVAQAPVTLNAGGVATFTVPNFGVGVHSVYATYGGSSNHLTSTSVIITNTVCPVISFGNIANGTRNTAYNQTITVSPANNYTFSIPIGQLPRGLSLNTTTGQISGIPVEAGIFNFTVVAKNDISCSKSKVYTLKIIGNNCVGRHFDQASNSPISTGSVPFAYPTNTAQGVAGDYHLATADFNNDGFLDVIVPSKDASNRAAYSLFLGNGTGNFIGGTPIATRATTGNNVAITVADFDNDGDKDVVLGEANFSELVILTNNGLGSFTISTEATGNGGGGIGIAVAAAAGDFNKDGKPDFAILSSGNKKAHIYLNTTVGGTISFVDTANPVGTDIFPRGIVVADFNDDDNLDIAVANYSNNIVANSVSVALGDGLGGFALATQFTVGLNCREIAAGDLDADGDIDLVTANYGTNTISILTNNGTGNFTVSAKAIASNMNGLVINDFNGDGYNDILASSQTIISPANTNSQSYLLLNNGSGTFATPTTLGSDYFAGGTQPCSLISGDFNNDGTVDFISANTGNDGNTGSLSVFLNNCPPTANDISLNHGIGVNANNVLIATTFDNNQASNTLTPKVNGAILATVNGITISDLAVNTNGNVTASVSTTCVATNTTFSISVTDNFNKTATATLTITIIAGPTITTQPNSQNACDATSINIPVVAAGLGLTYQWQISIDNGLTFNNLSNVSPYSGVTTDILGISTNQTLNGNKYKCVITGACSTQTSNIITLNIQNSPIVLSGGVPANTINVYNSTQINSTQIITPISNIEYRAGKSIVLNAGFFVDAQNVFKANIIGCQ